MLRRSAGVIKRIKVFVNRETRTNRSHSCVSEPPKRNACLNERRFGFPAEIATDCALFDLLFDRTTVTIGVLFPVRVPKAGHRRSFVVGTSQPGPKDALPNSREI